MGCKSVREVWSEFSIIKYANDYIRYGSELNDCTNKEDVKRHNKAMNKLSKLYRVVKELDEKGFLLDLLRHENPRVRRIVAAHCLGMNCYINEALRTLNEIIKANTNRHDVFTAQSIIEVWEKQNHHLRF